MRSGQRWADMERILTSIPQGSQVIATVWRNGAEKSLTVRF